MADSGWGDRESSSDKPRNLIIRGSGPHRLEMISGGPEELNRCREVRPNGHGHSPCCPGFPRPRSFLRSRVPLSSPAPTGSLIQRDLLVIAQLTRRQAWTALAIPHGLAGRIQWPAPIRSPTESRRFYMRSIDPTDPQTEVAAGKTARSRPRYRKSGP